MCLNLHIPLQGFGMQAAEAIRGKFSETNKPELAKRNQTIKYQPNYFIGQDSHVERTSTI